MCNATNCSHDLNDSLDDIFGDYEAGVPADLTLANAQQVKMHEEKCPSCKGSGVFRSYSGRVVGDCFKCKGKGTLFFRQSLEQREKAKAQRDARKEREAQSAADQAAEWLEANPVEAEWLREPVKGDFTFHADMLASLIKYGSFTERQEAAVRNAAAKSAARKAQWAAERAERDANKADVEIDRIAVAFATAKASGLKFPKLRLDDFTFSLASAAGRNAGAIYVKQDDLYLGKIADGKFTRSRDCDAATEARIVAVCADPAAAATAYGKRTGQCSCCGRELTNEESIARAIGPICASKWGL
jgi:uncharacterized Zn finger protein (UPF0148 family)